MTISDLIPGMEATIMEINTHDRSVVRLMVLGLVEGAPVKFRNAAIGGDPIEIDVMGASISVRREQAQYFHVSVN